MGHFAPTSARPLRRSTARKLSADLGHLSHDDALRLPSMVDATMRQRNADAKWNDFSSDDYWSHNYQTVQPEDREIIDKVSRFFVEAFDGRDLAGRAIDVGSGSNLYPALLMLPWADQILLTDYSLRNVNWLSHHVIDDHAPWTWHPFWHEIEKRQGYSQISEPRKQLKEACSGESEYSGIAQYSVFELPQGKWQLGTMFFVAESITQDPAEFRTAVSRFIGALEEGAPFAAAFMAGSAGYKVAGTNFPALQITPADVEQHLTALGVSGLSIYLSQTPHRVRPGYSGMIAATGIAGRPTARA